MAGTNGAAKAPTKAKPRALLEVRIEEQQKQIDTLAWLLASLLHELRVAIAQQYLQNPQVQQKLQEELLARLQGGQQ